MGHNTVQLSSNNLKNNNASIKKKINIKDDLLTTFGLQGVYDKYAYPYILPLNSDKKLAKDIPSIQKAYYSDITGNIKYEPNTMLRDLVFMPPKNDFNNLPPVSRQTIANAFRFRPGPVNDVCAYILFIFIKISVPHNS
ncbi:hypothetical protein AYI70_g1268 [Smittium culicis]|uniref:Uncharacterized protein n=1 Tax=Smittium culicis TaxID=133412 RepID=A0A1R1YDB0_9FUNG|nr:hypothetical protein AYI70_g1268 [Smittium culicis]